MRMLFGLIYIGFFVSMSMWFLDVSGLKGGTETQLSMPHGSWQEIVQVWRER